jgi:hypothetical protein
MRVAVSLCLASLLVGCGHDLSPTEASSAAAFALDGVSLRLDGRSPSGRHFRLARGTLELSGAASVVLRAPRDVNAGVLGTPLPGGSYVATLRPGFELHELLPEGGERTVAAEVVGKHPRTAHVSPGAAVELGFVFRVDGELVDIGSDQGVRLSDRR